MNLPPRRHPPGRLPFWLAVLSLAAAAPARSASDAAPPTWSRHVVEARCGGHTLALEVENHLGDPAWVRFDQRHRLRIVRSDPVAAGPVRDRLRQLALQAGWITVGEPACQSGRLAIPVTFAPPAAPENDVRPQTLTLELDDAGLRISGPVD